MKSLHGNLEGFLIFILFITLVFIAEGFSEEMYKWTDDKGTVHFTDDISKIPEKYQPSVSPERTPSRTKMETKEKDISKECLNLKWGASTEEFWKLTGERVIEVAGVQVGVIDISNIGGIKTVSADYRFYKSRFYACVIKMPGLEEYGLFKKALITKYGDPKTTPGVGSDPIVVSGTENTWIFHNQVRIRLIFYRGSLSAYLTYVYLPIEQQKEQDEKKILFEKTKDKL